MTATTEHDTAAAGYPAPSTPHRDRPRTTMRPGRVGTVVALIIGLILAGVTRTWSIALQDYYASTGPYAAGADQPAASTSTSLGNMDSFLLALLLGGLRGPLVMFLWVSSESQKNERDLEDFDTKVELIRLLQPEFVTVHIFQMWNKAYNISAQLASLPNKYAAILDAIQYGRNVDATRPNELNILLAIGGLYSQKLGETPNDREYYIKRVREETQYRPPSPNQRQGGSPYRHASLLDPQGNLLPALVKPKRTRPDDLIAKAFVPGDDLENFRAAAAKAGVALPASVASAAPGADQTIPLPQGALDRIRAIYNPQTPTTTHYIDADFNDGAAFQYLAPYQPYPYGVSPLAIGYDYAKRGQVLMVTTGQKPIQMSQGAVDSRPGLELKAWSEETWQRAIEDELKAFGREVPSLREQMELPTAMLPLDEKPRDPALIDRALFFYDRTARLANAAITEYHRHLASSEDYLMRFSDYSSHLETLTAEWHLCRADHAYLEAMRLPDGPQRIEALRRAAVDYRHANNWYQYMDLRYYVPAAAYPPGVDREKLTQLRKDPEALGRVYGEVMTRLRTDKSLGDDNASNREESRPYRERAVHRWRLATAALRAAGALTEPTTELATEPTTAPATAPSGAATHAAAPHPSPPTIAPTLTTTPTTRPE